MNSRSSASEIGRDRLADVEAVNQKLVPFVRARRQRSGHQTRERAERASFAAFGQTQRAGHESGIKLQVRIKRPPGDVRSRNHRLAQETRRKRRERGKPQPRSFRRQQAETHPCRARDRGEPNRKISRRPSRNHEPKDEEQRRPRGRRPRKTGGGDIRRRAQQASPTSQIDAMRGSAHERIKPFISPCSSLMRLGILRLRLSAYDAAESYHVPSGGGRKRRPSRAAHSRIRRVGTPSFDPKDRGHNSIPCGRLAGGGG